MKKYIRASFDNWVPDWLIRDNGAKRALNKLGIDLKKAVFSKEPSGRGKDYPIYFLDNSQVYIPGVYGEDSYVKDNRGNYKAAKYIAKKNLPITDVVYVAKEGFEKEPREHYVDPRYKTDSTGGKWEYQGQYYDKPYKFFDGTVREGAWRTRGGGRYSSTRPRDKSGYEIPNPADRLTKFYNSDEGTKKLAARLQKVYEELVALKDQIFALDFTSFGDNGDDYGYSNTDYQNLLGNFGDTCRDYRIALHDLEEAVSDYDRYKDRQFSRYNIKSVFDSVSHIERKIKDYKKAIETGRYW